MAHVLIFLLVAHLLIFLSNPTAILAAGSTNESKIDRQALLFFKQGISNDPLDVLSSWGSDSPYCSWRGVTCGNTLPLHVVSLQLNNLQLSGELSPSLNNLTSITRLNLGNNSFYGSIPEELGNGMSLSYVNLANNSLTGGIPLSLVSSSSLRKLILSRNNLTGQIPATLFANTSTLTRVDLQMNSLTGVIPPFGKVTSLKYLCVTGNLLSGSIPPSIANASSLRSILLGQNRFTGSIPESLQHISRLLELDLSFNSLSGLVPLPLYNMSSLEYFSLGSNALVGQVPSDIGYTLPNLQVLIMQNNNLAGLIPSSLENASNLQVLDLSNNSLHGRVPSLGSLAKLSQVLLGRNQLEAYDWQFLASLANCTQLTKLSLEGNMLIGSLPGSIVGNISTSLENLLLGSNQISGSIPVEIGDLVNLTLLSMENNLLSGGIPDTIGKLQNLFILNLSKNNLSGQIPYSIGNITQLGKLFLDDNGLTGNIPGSLGMCLGMVQLNLSSNSFDGILPEELFTGPSLSFGLDLSHNNLTGEISEEIGQLLNIVLLNVSNNQFSGAIPSALGTLSGLSSLRMEVNKLEGPIPETFGRLLSIQYINLSRNELNGTFPEFFEKLGMLEKLDMSYNNLEGAVPTGGRFLNSTFVVILDGNTGLCSSSSESKLALPICDGTFEIKKYHVPLLLIVIPLVAITSFLFLWFLVTLWKKRVFEFPQWRDVLSMLCLLLIGKNVTDCRPKGIELQTLPSNYETPTLKKVSPSNYETPTLKKVSYSDILRATNCFSSVHTISCTRTGSVYIGRFKYDKSLVAIKVFNLDEPAAYESYFIECEVLRSTRHRNLMRPVTLCSTLDTGNHEFKALIFKFMVNGSLERWLHCEYYSGMPERVLSLGQRICIAADVASALDYIHNHVTPPLVHCDLKPSNILLDDDMTARLSDFGSAKFLFPGLIIPKSLVEVGGTIGYMAPEYGMGSEITTGGDVYSFGVLLLEMLTGKQPTDDLFVDDLNLHNFTDSMFPDRIAEIIDPHMLREESQMLTEVWMQSYIIPLVALGLSCSMKSPKDRPGMRDVCAKVSAVKEGFLKFHSELSSVTMLVTDSYSIGNCVICEEAIGP